MNQPSNVIELAPVTFEDWWQQQFHKIGKVLCMAKWAAITSPEGYPTRMMDKSTGQFVEIHLQATPQEINDGQKRQNAKFYEDHGFTENTEAKQYVRRPVQFLNQGGWMDE